MRFILIILTFITLGSCALTGNYVNFNPKNKSAGNLAIEQLSEVSKKDQMFAVYADVPFAGSMKFAVTKKFEYISAPFSVKSFYHHARFGEVYGQYTFPIYLDEPFQSQDDPETAYRKNRSEFQFNYSFPVFNRFYINKKFGMTIDPDVRDGFKYKGRFPCAVNTKINLTAGIQHTFNIHQSYAYANYKIEQGEEDIINNKPAPLEQWGNHFRAGISFQSFINTRMIGSGDGKNFKGYLSRISTIYVNALFMLRNNVTPVNYFNYDGTYTVDFTPYLINVPLGYSVGFNVTSKYWDKRPVSAIGFEFGLRPGSYDRASDGLYFMYTMGIGIGLIKPKSNVQF